MAQNYTLYRLIDRLSLFWIIASFTFGLFGFSFAYYFLSSSGAGLVATYDAGQVSYLDSLYFSAVTITSLGYGDLRPVGFARLLAASEVVYGLAIMGIAIAKMASERQSFFLKRIYAGDLQRRIRSFQDSIEICTSKIKQAIGAEDVEGNRTLTGNSIGEMLAVLQGVRKYFGFEIYHGELLKTVANKAFRQLIESIMDYLRVGEGIGTITGIPRENRIQLRGTLRFAREIAKMLEFNTKNNKLKELCKELVEEIERQRALRKELNAVEGNIQQQ